MLRVRLFTCFNGEFHVSLPNTTLSHTELKSVYCLYQRSKLSGVRCSTLQVVLSVLVIGGFDSWSL